MVPVLWHHIGKVYERGSQDWLPHSWALGQLMARSPNIGTIGDLGTLLIPPDPQEYKVDLELQEMIDGSYICVT